jgi:hypothetical protein
MLHGRLLRVLLLRRTVMWRAMLLKVLTVLPLWTGVASTLLTLRARGLRTYVWCRILLPIRTVVDSGRALLRRTLVMRRDLRVLWIVAAIGLRRIVRLRIISTTLIATASASERTTTALSLLVLWLLLRVSVLRMLLLLVWRIAGRRRWGRRVVVLLGARHRTSDTLLLLLLLLSRLLGRVRLERGVASGELLMQVVAF